MIYLTEETKKKISLAKKGKISTFKGKRHTEEAKLKIGLAHKGKFLTEEHKMKIGLGLQGHIPWSRNKRLEKTSFKKHWNYQGGISDLRTFIYRLPETRIWRNFIFQRDDYKCVDCNIQGNLEVHHIKPFSILLQEFLSFYNQFSPIEDKETLIRLAITYAPFWDITNGKTLCENCHSKYKKIKE